MHVCVDILIAINLVFLTFYTDRTVLQKFVHVFVAHLHVKPLAIRRVKFPEVCAQMCLKDERCISFNFNKLDERCELLSVNAESRTLEPSDNQYDDYYQLIGE